MNQTVLGEILRPLASLKLTVTLLVLSMVLIFAGTTIQSEMSVWDVQRLYFHSWLTFIEWRLFFPLWHWGSRNIPGAMPFPGGYTLIVLLLMNLLAAHALRFKFSWKRSGIILIHAGLILLLVGEVITAEKADEGQMILDVGSSSNWTQDVRQVELAVIDPAPEDHDLVVAVPAGRMVDKSLVQHPQLPFAIRVDEFFPNSQILGPMQAGAAKDARATAGAGVGLTVLPQPRFSGAQSQNVDMPSAYVTLLSGQNNLGTYLVSLWFQQPQTVRIDGKDYLIQLRFRRQYKPYTIHLLKFSHDRYTGTDIPKNFSSLVRLVDPEHNVDRQALIRMNHPLRYRGETFYQASFLPGDQTSILQVVRNPAWLLPYVSCAMVGVGLLVHFAINLRPATHRQAPQGHWTLPAIVTVVCLFYALWPVRPYRPDGPFDLDTFARLPVLYDGRTMPLDSLARNSLRILSGRSELRTEAGNRPAIEWLTDVFARPERATAARVFRIDHPDILSLLGLDESRKLFSVQEIQPAIRKLQEQFDLAFRVDKNQRDPYQRKVVELGQRILLFNRLAELHTLYLSPPLASDQWRSFAQAIQDLHASGQRDPGTESFVAMIQAYHEGRPDEFNAIAAEYLNLIRQKMPQTARKLDVEVLFNRAAPFYHAMGLYVTVFVLAAVSWLKWHGPLARAALWALILTLVLHTLGLAARIYLQGRPPVTNLYSSAIFIAWAAAVFCVVIEIFYRNGVACAAAAAIAFPSLLIAHHLAGSGDTMQMLQAVLDTNFWLATHVLVITLGYAATFLAGFLGIVYVLGGIFVPDMTIQTRQSLARMIYGVVCFALLFSFAGTILGGIWADQSWGRFWGWDPKENGAALIVLWNAIILHARWAGIVQHRGVALLAIFGNVVTAWSWFGTNMLGVGLHSYGFMDSAAFWLAAFVGSQLLIIVIGLLVTEKPRHQLSSVPEHASISS